MSTPQIKTTLNEVLIDQRKDTADAWALYRVLLRRFDKPKSGDKQSLVSVMATLGLTPTDVEEHAEAIANVGELRNTCPAVGECNRLADIASAAIPVYEETKTRLNRELAENLVRYENANADEITLRSDRQNKLIKISNLRKKYSMLFGENESLDGDKKSKYQPLDLNGYTTLEPMAFNDLSCNYDDLLDLRDQLPQHDQAPGWFHIEGSRAVLDKHNKGKTS